MKVKIKQKNIFLAVDPGLNGTGWVVFKGTDKKFIHNGVITFGGKDWQQKAINIAHRLCNICLDNDIRNIFIEYPAYFDSAAGSMVAKKGDLLKLTFLVGVITGFLEPKQTILVPVNKWKGQLPKFVVANRVKDIVGPKLFNKLKSHDIDACGIGLFIQGHFK